MKGSRGLTVGEFSGGVCCGIKKVEHFHGFQSLKDLDGAKPKVVLKILLIFTEG